MCANVVCCWHVGVCCVCGCCVVVCLFCFVDGVIVGVCDWLWCTDVGITIHCALCVVC